MSTGNPSLPILQQVRVRPLMSGVPVNFTAVITNVTESTTINELKVTKIPAATSELSGLACRFMSQTSLTLMIGGARLAGGFDQGPVPHTNC